jgi:signal transduction histidine kinase
MNRSRTVWWTLYGTGSILALVALGWVSKVLLEMESEKLLAQKQAQRANVMHLALWRMDSWLAPQLAQEASRPYFEYLPFVPNDRAYTRLLSTIEAGEVLRPSPLLSVDSEFFPLHFQFDAKLGWSSPQVPTGNQLDLAQGSLVAADFLERKRQLFEQVQQVIQPSGMVFEMGCAEVGFGSWMIAPGSEQAYASEDPLQDDNKEFSKRVQSNLFAQNFANNQNVKGEDVGQLSWAKAGPLLPEPQFPGSVPAPQISVGPLLPIWLEGAPASRPFEIYFLRRIENGARPLMQGFVANWELLRSTLLEQVADLFPTETVQLVRGEITDAEHASQSLAAIPARLEVSYTPLAGRPAWTPARVTLTLAWFAVLLALAGVAFSLRASISYGEKRSRFASSVTHELRTPLTTFRMYTEMLAKGMVEEESRVEYLQTLQRESDRLSVLVENVLAYARLEDGRSRLARETIRVSDLMERSCAAPTEQLLNGTHQLRLNVTVPEGTNVQTDPSAVEQILFNLVDNACKYGRSGAAACIDIRANLAPGQLVIQVRDQGPGVSPKATRAIFRPFDRGSVDAADPNPGIGLGLALCRGLAQDLGGQLNLLPSDEAGACFELRLPLLSS